MYSLQTSVLCSSLEGATLCLFLCAYSVHTVRTQPFNKLKAGYCWEQLHRISSAVHLPLWHTAGHVFVYAEFLTGDTTTTMTSLSQEHNFQFYCMVSRKAPGKKGNAYPKAWAPAPTRLTRTVPASPLRPRVPQPGFGYRSVALSVLAAPGTKSLGCNNATANICFILWTLQTVFIYCNPLDTQTTFIFSFCKGISQGHRPAGKPRLPFRSTHSAAVCSYSETTCTWVHSASAKTFRKNVT